jgi:2-polyprenyl-3-methyl-5-hydroxy-6-metoxy-1,4-benzoquinol methylase
MKAQFNTRTGCITCGSANLKQVSDGRFDEGPLHDFLSSDIWGESPVPFLADKPWAYVQCDCGQRFHKYVLTPEWNDINFSRWMSAEAIAEYVRSKIGYSRSLLFERATHFTKHVLQLASLIEERPLRVLDFGCGNGEFLALCHQFGFETTGVDRSKARRDKAGDVFASIDELEDRTFHAITLFEVLEHLEEPAAVLRNLRKHLLPGGVLILETPDCTGVERIESRRDYDAIHPLQHINGFTPATMRSLAERVGFKAIAKPVSHVTTSPVKVATTEARRVLGKVLKPSTQQYFTV